MDKSEDNLLTIVRQFFSRISDPKYHLTTCGIEDLRNTKKRLQSWNKSPGLYYFVQRDEVKYVGRATPDVGIGRRVYEHAGALGGKDGWDDVINDQTVRCGLIVFNDREDWHWLVALEVLLIDKLRPQFNKRY